VIERRKVPRHRTLLGGEVSHNPQYAPVRCVVRNLSEEGARLALDPAALLPAEVEVAITVRAEVRPARVVWRRGESVGVAFTEAQPASEPISLDLARRLRDSESENRDLRRRLAAHGAPA
jgi:hypothetical protein